MNERRTPRTMREAFPCATFASLYSFVEQDPERRLVGPAIKIISVVVVALIFVGVIQL